MTSRTRSPRPAQSDRGRRATIREVAALAEVSLGTASRVINKVPNVAPEIRDKVLRAIRTLGYTPDMVAQSMRNGESKTVGILVRNITSPVLAGFVRSAQEVLNAEDYTVLLACFEESREREIAFLRTAASRRIDGLIVTTTSETDTELLEMRAAVGIPTVLFDRECPATDDALLIAHEQGIAQSLDQLLALGHRRIAFLTGSESVYPARARLRGYRRFFEDRGLAVDERLVKTSSFAEDGSFIETSTVLGLAEPPTAIVLGGTRCSPARCARSPPAACACRRTSRWSAAATPSSRCSPARRSRWCAGTSPASGAPARCCCWIA